MLARRLLWLLALTTLVLSVGCRRKNGDVDVSELVIMRYRLNVDDAQRVARIMAEVTNTGKRTVPEATITAVLQGPGDDPYNSGDAVVKKLKPGEKRPFSIQIDAKGRERDVEFIISGPKDPEEEAESNAEQ